MDNIIQNIKSCSFCSLRETCKEPVIHRGNIKNPRIMIVGEAPGKNEDEQGKPFVGKAGKLLDKTIKEASIPQSEIYITNIVKCRPPKNRDPKINEVIACSAHLRAQISHLRPSYIVPLGSFATKFMLRHDKRQNLSMAELHGHKFKFNDYWVLPIYHPAATFYDHSKLEAFKKDFGKLGRLLERQR